MNRVRLIILGMIIATSIPRLLPFIFKTNKELPPWINRFLSFVPYTAIGALTIPGGILATRSYTASSIGLIIAAIYSWKKGGMMGPIVVGVVGTLLILL